jgi:hypothetical protein
MQLLPTEFTTVHASKRGGMGASRHDPPELGLQWLSCGYLPPRCSLNAWEPSSILHVGGETGLRIRNPPTSGAWSRRQRDRAMSDFDWVISSGKGSTRCSGTM